MRRIGLGLRIGSVLVLGAVVAGCGAPDVTPNTNPRVGASLPPGAGSTYYLAPDGSDDADGTIDDPWATMLHAAGHLEPGDVLLARGGTYQGQGGAGWAASGTDDAPIWFGSYPGESAIFDGGGTGSFLILEDVSYLHVSDLTITGYSPEGTGVIVIIGDSTGVTLERLTMYGHQRESSPGVWTEHLIYPGQGPVRDLVVRDNVLDMTGLQGDAVHVYHDPGPINLLVEGNTITNAHWGVLIDSDARGVTVRDNVMGGNDIDVAVLDERAADVEVEPQPVSGPP